MTRDRDKIGSTETEAIQALDKSPIVPDEIEAFEISWNSRTPDTWIRDLFETVASAKSLLVLNVKGFNDKTYSKSDCLFVEDQIGGLESLSELSLAMDGFDMTESLFSKICGLPQLRELYTSARVYGPRPLRETIISLDYGLEGPNSVDQRTKLIDLRCYGDYLDLEALRITVNRSPNIEQLLITLPGPGVVSDSDTKRGGAKSGPHSDVAYRPCLIPKAIFSAALTLRTLPCMNYKVRIPFHDGSLPDLSHFHRLEELQISVRLLARSESQGKSQQDLGSLPGLNFYKNLPQNLEILGVHFDCPNGLL